MIYITRTEEFNIRTYVHESSLRGYRKNPLLPLGVEPPDVASVVSHYTD